MTESIITVVASDEHYAAIPAYLHAAERVRVLRPNEFHTRFSRGHADAHAHVVYGREAVLLVYPSWLEGAKASAHRNASRLAGYVEELGLAPVELDALVGCSIDDRGRAVFDPDISAVIAALLLRYDDAWDGSR